MKAIIFLLILSSIVFSQITGLEGWDIYLDPGHSQKENMGIYGYSEAERNLRVGLRLREMLLNETDIDTVWNSRTNDTQVVSLSQRTDQANSLGASWYHSIHSDAGASTYNSTLLMYGGWRENGMTVEKTPHGGKVMADYIVDLLTRGMRISTRGNYADRTFYQGFPDNHDYKYPYLHVNRESNMPSELSESGFHTNPTQNQRFMNDDWKRLEARTIYWSILKYHHIARPLVRILTGIVSDVETDIPINGAQIKVGDRVYTTDTYESLFNRFTDDPEQLHNGFYYLEDINSDEAEIIVSADGYEGDTVTVTMVDTFFTFADFELISKAIPKVISTVPANEDTGYSVLDDIVIRFSRPMNTDSVESNIMISPAIGDRFTWGDLNRELTIRPDQLEFNTVYTVTISGNAMDNYGHNLDGNGDGTGGDDFVFQFKTGFDNVPPELTQIYPKSGSGLVEVLPIINIEYSEELDEASITPDIFKLERFKDGTSVTGTLKHYVVNKRSVLDFFPDDKLFGKEVYVNRIYPGLRDLLNNEISKTESKSFMTGEDDFQITVIDNFETGLTSNWWTPDQSGTKAGYDPGTSRSENNEYTNLLTGSNTSMEFYYDWDVNAAEWIIREYLSGGAPRSVFFTTDYKLQIYIFGDGSGNQFRFAIDEGTSSSNLPYHEVSQWYTIDWIGWKLVQWDLSDPNSVGEWIGNGVLDGTTYRFDSIQLTHVPGANETGSLYFDDLRLVKPVPATDINSISTNIPTQYYLDQNYPNPFNPETEISFGLPEAAHVKIEIYNMLGQRMNTIVNDFKTAGVHKIKFDGSLLPSGLYVYKMETPGFQTSKRMVILK